MARKIYGRINVEGGIPPGTQLRVIAWDADIDDDDHMGTVLVSDDGSYSIEYLDEKWDWTPLTSISKWRPDIYIVVDRLDPSSLLWKTIAQSRVYSDQDVRIDREIDLAVILPHTTFNTVYGSVINKQGNPLQGYTITAWDEDPAAIQRRRDSTATSVHGEATAAEFLGSAVSDNNGKYRIQYAGNPLEMAPRWNIQDLGRWWRKDVFIKVHGRDGSGVLYRSPTHQNVFSLTGCRIDAPIDEI